METAVYDAFKEVLKDAKTTINGEEKTLLDIVTYWEEGVEKTKTANKDLTAQRETWETKEKEYKQTITDVEKLKSDLETQLSEIKGKSGKKDEQRTELEKMINTLTDQVNSLKEASENAEKKAQEMEEKASKANYTASIKSLREKILTGLSEHKITGNRAELAIETIMAKEFAKLVKDDETGLYSESFCTQKDGKLLAADVGTMCKWFADTNQFLVEGSGKPGTGNQHNSSGPSKNSGGKRNYLSMIDNKE